MASFTFTRPISRRPSSQQSSTPGNDYLRGSGDDEFVRDLIEDPDAGIHEQTIFDQLTTRSSRREAFWLIVSGAATRPLDDSTALDLGIPGLGPVTEFELYQLLFDFFGVTTAQGALLNLEPFFGPADTGPAPDNGNMAGNDTYLGRGGTDFVIDLVGNNSVRTEDGDDWIRLGNGRDFVYDRGGDNDIAISGGDNSVTTRDGDDLIVTGPGDDVINAGDGDNTVQAGDGDNVVSGGDDLDYIEVGIGEDIVNLRMGSLLLDADGNPIPDGSDDGFGADAGFADNTLTLDLSGLVDFPLVFEAHNWAFDNGGSDIFTASGNARSEPVDGNPDLVFNGDDAVIDDLSLATGAPDVVGDDLASLGEGANLYVGFGGNDSVIAGSGADAIFTSLEQAGDDEITAGDGNNYVDTGAGDDTITAGEGSDIIIAGAGSDRIVSGPGDIESSQVNDVIYAGPGTGARDGAPDTIRVNAEDLLLINASVPLGAFIGAADFIHGFDADGTDTFEFSSEFTALGFGPGNVLTFGTDVDGNEITDIGLLLDADGSGGFSVGDAIAAVLVDGLADPATFAVDIEFEPLA